MDHDRADEAMAVEPFGGVGSWARIRWPDDAPLPEPGHELNVAEEVDGGMTIRVVRVIHARPDFEPGWIGVEVVPG